MYGVISDCHNDVYVSCDWRQLEGAGRVKKMEQALNIPPSSNAYMAMHLFRSFAV